MSSDAFVVYRLMASVFQAETIMVPSKNFTHDLEAFWRPSRRRPGSFSSAIPNNPTGTMVDGAGSTASWRGFRTRGGCSDEAYIELLPEETAGHAQIRQAGHKVYILRTFSKTTGWPVCASVTRRPKEGIDLLHRVRSRSTLNAMGQIAPGGAGR